MGLDMYLQGEKFFFQSRLVEDGFKVSKHTLELGYWRKHPNLHGFIVETFAKGMDDCQDIELSKESIVDIINAVVTNKLPHTEGFFFGQSGWSEDHTSDKVVKVFQNALDWLESAP